MTIPHFRVLVTSQVQVLSCVSRLFGWVRQSDWRVGAHMFRNQINMTAQSVAGPFDLDNHGVMRKPVQQSGCRHRVAKNITPFGETAV